LITVLFVYISSGYSILKKVWK